MQGGKSSEAATGDKSPFLPVQQDRTFNKPSPLWKRVGAPVGSTEAEVAPAAALATAAAAAAAPALLGETVPLRQGRTRLELKEAPSRRRIAQVWVTKGTCHRQSYPSVHGQCVLAVFTPPCGGRYHTLWRQIGVCCG